MVKLSNFTFRENHLLHIFHGFDPEKGAIDLYLRNYFKQHKALGSKDRRFIAESVYGMIRWKGLLDFLCREKPSWEERYTLFTEITPSLFKERTDIPLHIRVSFPQTLFQLLVAALGEKEALAFCTSSNEPAPITIRVNSAKTTRSELLQKWGASYDLIPCTFSPLGIIFKKRVNFFELEEFKAGLFEVQDEGSQLISHLVKATSNDLVMDYCAGSGGKTLGFAPHMAGKGQIFLHDIRTHTLYEAKKRLKRAGIQNAQILLPDDLSKKAQLKKKMDWVLVDAPCSGTGTLRRNPDVKWKFSPEILERLVKEQRAIFKEALSFLHPQGHIVYATCSVLPQENEEQLAYFKKTFNLTSVAAPLQTLPSPGGMDGFFGVVLKYL